MISKNTIPTDRLVLRRWKKFDLEPFYQMNSDPEIMKYLSAPLSREDSDAMVGRMEDHFERNGFRNKSSIAVMERLGMKRNPIDDFDHPKISEGSELRGIYFIE